MLQYIRSVMNVRWYTGKPLADVLLRLRKKETLEVELSD